MGEAGGLADHHPDPGAPLAARGQLLDPAVVQDRRAGLAVLGEDLGHVAALGQRGGQDPFEDVSVDQRGCGHGVIVMTGPATTFPGQGPAAQRRDGPSPDTRST